MAALALSGNTTSLAQPGGAIAYGQTVSGEISNAAFRVVYTFTGEQGEIIDSEMRRQGGNLDPLLILLGSDNTLIARDDDSGPGSDARLTDIALPSTGLYFLIATRFGQDRGLTTGQFSLTLARTGVTGDPRLLAGALALDFGNSAVRELDDARFEDIYTFTVLRGDVINLTMNRISGDLDPVLILADAEGNVLLISDDDPTQPGTLNAAITSFRILRSGSYLIAATRFGGAAGSSQGGYSLSLDRLSADTFGDAPERAIFLEFGATVSGQISAEQAEQYYLIDAREGDVLAIEMTRTGGNLDPVLQLYTADLRLITGHDAGARGRNARITAFRVQADTQFILVATRFNGQAGRSAGDYTLALTRTR